MKTVRCADGGAFNDGASWWRLSDISYCVGATWFLMERVAPVKIYLKNCGPAVVDDFGDLVRVPYTCESFNQPEH